jgi:ADP-ribose pyrophosphatase YjhB (NUDIX family)
MIRFDQGNRRFNYRVVGVAIHDGSILIHRAGEEPFWTLPGGRAEHGETAEATIRREMREELATDIDVVRLLWFVENFFEYEGVHYHELALYFLIRFPSGSAPLSAEAFDGSDAGVLLRFRWFPVLRDELARLPLMPPFLPEALTELPASFVHLVHHETAPSSIAPG